MTDRVIQVEPVDDERGSIHGKKKPPDRSPKVASRPAGQAGDDGEDYLRLLTVVNTREEHDFFRPANV